MVQRNFLIDFLRGFAMLAMILIHTSYYFIGDRTASFLWNYAQFAVPIFVFCSAFLFVQKEDFTNTSWKDLIQFYKKYIPKRLLRLLIPYYTFIPFFFLVLFFVEPGKLTISYILQSLLLVGGIDINWLVLLFVQLTLLFPLYQFLHQNYKEKSFLLPIFLLFFILFTFYQDIAVSYKWVMWIGWSFFFFVAKAILKFRDDNKMQLKYFTLLLIPWSILHWGLSPTLLITHKYPPDTYFLFYGILWIIGLTLLYKYVSLPSSIEKGITYLSVNSYQLYFIHYCVLIFLASYKHYFSWYTFFLTVTGISILIQLGIHKGQILLRGKKD